MIAQVSSIAIPTRGVSKYLDHVEQDVLPRYRAAPGLAFIHILQRELVAYVEVVMVSLWDSEEALNVFLKTLSSSDASTELLGIAFESRTYTVLVSGQNEPKLSDDEAC